MTDRLFEMSDMFGDVYAESNDQADDKPEHALRIHSPEPDSLADLFGDVIHAYTREQAIADGVLVDLSETNECRELGFKFRVACTREVWNECIELTPAAKRACNDVAGRLWDLLYMLHDAIRRSRGSADRIDYEIRCVVQRVRPSVVRLKAICGPADDGSPCITIMYPDQD